MAHEILNVHSYVFRDLPEEKRRDVPPGVKGNCRAASIGVPILPVRTALPNLNESEIFKYARNFPWL